MKAFRFYLDVDAKNMQDAKNQLIDMSGGMSFGDLECIELDDTSNKITTEQLMKHLKIKKNQENLFNKVEPLYSGWDGWACKICGHTVGCDTGDMFDHLKYHSISELKKSKEEIE